MSMPPDDVIEAAYQYVTEVRTKDGVKIYHDPVFVLRAQDKLAPLCIERWADLLEAEERKVRLAMDGPYQPSWKVREARAIAHEMRAWQERNCKKVPD